MALAACCLELGACTLQPQAWSLDSLVVDHDPWAMLLPTIAHHFKIKGYRRQLRRRCVAYFYCEFFHINP